MVSCNSKTSCRNYCKIFTNAAKKASISVSSRSLYSVRCLATNFWMQSKSPMKQVLRMISLVASSRQEVAWVKALEILSKMEILRLMIGCLTIWFRSRHLTIRLVSERALSNLVVEMSHLLLRLSQRRKKKESSLLFAHRQRSISKVWTKTGQHTPRRGVVWTPAPSMVRVTLRTCQLVSNKTGREPARNEIRHLGTTRASCHPSSAYLWLQLKWISLPTTSFPLTHRTNTKSFWTKI